MLAASLGRCRIVDLFKILGRVFLESLDAVLAAESYEAVGFTVLGVGVVDWRAHVATF